MEKGKNLATKQDISEITKLVETVKHTFTAETEKLKTNLSIYSNVHVGLVAEERNAIIEHNEKFFRWLNNLTDHHFGNVDDVDNNDIDKQIKNIGDSFRDFLNSETKLKLFVYNENLIQYAQEMKIETMKKVAPFAPKCLLQLN